MAETSELIERQEVSVENLWAKLGKDSKETIIRDIKFMPVELSPPTHLVTFQVKEKTLENVSLSYTRINNFHFTKCTFRGTDLVECRFVDCEFHDCKFEKVDLWKSKFYRTYLDPSVFVKLYNPSKDSNKGVGLFQSLLFNAAESHQPEFEVTARYQFYRWQRFQLEYDFKGQQLIAKPATVAKIVWNLIKQWTVGYGLKLTNFLVTSVVLYSAATILNYRLWGEFAMKNKIPSNSSGIDSLYFTMVTLLTVGFGDIIPTSALGRGMITAEAILSVLWLGLLTGILVRKVIK